MRSPRVASSSVQAWSDSCDSLYDSLVTAYLERVPRLVDDQDVKHDVVLVHVDVGLRVHGVREARQLSDLGKML